MLAFLKRSIFKLRIVLTFQPLKGECANAGRFSNKPPSSLVEGLVMTKELLNENVILEGFFKLMTKAMISSVDVEHLVSI